MKTEAFKYKDFTKVEISSTFDFKIVQSDSYEVTVDADEGLFKNLHIDVDGDTLKAYHSRHISWVFRLSRPHIKISMPVIKELKLSGAVSGKVSGFKSAEDFKLEMDGASKVKADMEVNKCEIRMRGACNIEANGKAESIIIDVNGANFLDMEDFTIQNAAIRLNGASNCKVRVDGRLDARLAGVSNLDLAGQPTIGDIRTTGLAKINKIS
jgi:hypothetical protein